MTAQVVRDVVKGYAEPIRRLELAVHDLRRTFAKRAHKGGAGLDHIQLTLGHTNIKPTEKHQESSQNLTDAHCNHLGLALE